MSIDTHPTDVDADDLDLGRAAEDLRATGLSWPAIADQLAEPQVYVQRAHTAYLAHVDKLAARDQLSLFDDPAGLSHPHATMPTTPPDPRSAP